MHRSPELKDLMLQFYRAAADGDTAFMQRVHSHDPGSLMIGTDPSEWWEGPDAIARAWYAQIEALGGGMPIVAGDPQAWEEGDAGWVADQPVFRLPGQPDAPFRVTAVFHREDGAWKIVQAHASIGLANEDAFGQELPTG